MDGNYEFVVLGGGLAGLTFALQASRRGRKVLVLERENQVGGLARTLRFGDFSFDIGGHRFHSRWPEVAHWVMALLKGELCEVSRRSRIRLADEYIDYPLRFPNAFTAFNPVRGAGILASYAWSTLGRWRRCSDLSLEDWVRRRFGRALYEIYFKPYTEKLWGVPCHRISADWATQRIRVPSLTSAVVGSVFPRVAPPAALVSSFSYPSQGIGMLSERMAGEAADTGRATISLVSRALSLEPEGPSKGWQVRFEKDGKQATAVAAQVVSTLPLDGLLGMLPWKNGERAVLEAKLPYRSIACVFLAIDGASLSNDTWTYFPDREVLFGRTHEPRNWSPCMAPENATSLCVEIFCSKDDAIWSRPDSALVHGALDGLDRLGIVAPCRVKNARVLRISHAYPIYHVGYSRDLAQVTSAVARFDSLHLLGRTGTFRYLNMDAVIRDGLQLAESLCPSA